MATPLTTETSRPGPPGRGSFHGYGDTGRPSVGNEIFPDTIYEGYNITPRDPEYKGQARWFQALTEPIPGTQQGFRGLIRKHSPNSCSALDELYSSRMKGSKRDHIQWFINTKIASNPERTYELAYLKLEQYPKRKTKCPSKKTFSIQMLLECKPRLRNATLPSQPVATNGPAASYIGPAPMGLDSTRINPGVTPPSAMACSRPQYLPPHVRQNHLHGDKNYPDAVTLNNRDSRDIAIESATRAENDSDSDDSDERRPISPCSTMSSDTVMSSSRRVSSSSIVDASGSSPKSVSRDFDENLLRMEVQTNIKKERRCISKSSDRDDWPSFYLESRASPNSTAHGQTGMSPTECREQGQQSSTQQFYTSTGTQTDQGLDLVGHEGLVSGGLQCPKPEIEPVAPKTTEMSSQTQVPASENNDDVPKTQLDEPLEAKAERSDRGTERESFYEKPVWMNDLRPVTPTIKDENIDPLDAVVTYETTSKDHEAKDHGEPNDIPSIPAHEIPTEGHDKTFTQLREDTPDRPSKPREDLSPRQRKRVTFSLPSPPSTVPSTPVIGTPLSSPDTETSSSDSFSFPPSLSKEKEKKKKKTAASSTPRRPPLNRTSHSTSSYASNGKSHEQPPPRSSSYKDLPINNSSDEYANPPNRSRGVRPPASVTVPVVQAPTRRSYDCKVGRCARCELGFSTREHVEAHMRSAHGLSSSGRSR